jgi:hypothetical protein
MEYLVIKLQNGQPLGPIETHPPLLYTSLVYLFPGIEFPPIPNQQQLVTYDYGLYEWAYPTGDLPYTQSVAEEGLKKFEDGVWRHSYGVRGATQEEVEARTALKAEAQRAERDRQLRQSDWSQLPDAPIANEKREQYITYRQLLRNLPTQAGFPWVVTFPEKP